MTVWRLELEKLPIQDDKNVHHEHIGAASKAEEVDPGPR
jgi:hypothetical protein